jgi:tetratricopeptide (TPR) repeat protein
MKLCSCIALALLCWLVTANAREYYVNLQGSDDNNGFPREQAFRTIQKGVSVLTAGDILTIGPGEYFESVCRTNLGGPHADTIIRSEVPGAAMLRGDRPAPEFKKVVGYRFVYSAPFDQAPTAVLEHNTLRVMHPKANATELEFEPGFYHYDTNSRTLFISNPDLVPPDQRRYTVAVNGNHGLDLMTPRRVIIEGLAAAGFCPQWGLSLVSPDSCVVRDCVAFLNVGGICLSPTNGIGGNGGPSNLVEGCVAYGNSYAGIARHGANNDVIRNCYLYKNIREGGEHFGIIHYGNMVAALRMTNNISWGHNFNYSVKGNVIACESLHNSVGLGYIRINPAMMGHNLIGSGNEYDRSSSAAPADNILFAREEKLDQDFEFADPLNLDFRLQPDSRYRNSAPDKSDRGPYPYHANIFYLSPAGNDAADGLSMRKPWKTLERALKGLKPGDTVYLAEGEYVAAPLNKAGDGKAPIRICGRARGTVVITGKQIVTGGEGISLERLNFAGGLALSGSRKVGINNCTFYGAAEGFSAEGVKDLKITHSVFMGVPLDLKKTSGAILSGNLYANSGKPAVRLDDAGAIRYSDYNNYADKEQCWKVGGKAWSFAELQKSHDRYSLSLVPEFAVVKGVPRLKEDSRFKSLGPHSTALGLHHEYEPVSETMSLVGPFLHSANDTTANIEWWGSRPAAYTLAWGETPEMTNTVSNLPGPERFNTFSLAGLKPGRKYYLRIKSAAPDQHSAPLPLSQGNEPFSFTTAAKAVEPRVYHVAPGGNDGNSGLKRDQALRTVNRAASLVGPGDTVMIANGEYNETVRIRATGTRERPITFRSAPGEKAVFKDENLSRFLEVIVKPDLRFDGLYFRPQGMWGQGCVVRHSERVQFTRCLNVTVAADESPGMLIQNCVAYGGWSAVGLSRSPGSRVDNNVFKMTILRQLSCDSSTLVRGNIFCECIRGKAHQTLLELPADVAESNNCFYVRWPEDEKLAINNRPLTEYRVRTGSDALYANPMMPGSPGWNQGWQASSDKDFDEFFTTNPELVLRGIGLQPEAFSDFKLGVTNWPYGRAWAGEVVKAAKAAGELVKAGKDAEALAAYTNIAAILPMTDRLKSEILDQAALCANRLKNYDQAMALAKQIPLKPLWARRQMVFMLEQKHYGDLLAAFNESALGGANFHQSWMYPEQEDVMADLYYYRSIAYAHSNNLAAAEADLKIMNDKRFQLGYRSGESIHDLTWLRLGDFYRDQLKDDDRAYAAYTNITDRTTWTFWGRPRKPAARGADETLVAATKAASDILRKKGKNDEVVNLQYNLLLAQAEAAAAMLKEGETVAQFKEIMAMPGKTIPAMESYEKRINALPDEARTNAVKSVGGLTTGLLDDTRDLLVKLACAPDAGNRSVALRSLLMFAQLDKVNELLDKIEKAGREKAIREELEPKVKRMRELSQAQKWQDLVNEFKDTDFAAWQDKELSGSAFNIRGRAYYCLKMADKAEADLKKGLEKRPDDQEAWLWLANNYRENLKDEDKALEAFKKLVGQGYSSTPLGATLQAAAILRARNKNEEALNILQTIDRGKITAAWGVWRMWIFSAYLDTLAALGRQADAIAECKKLLEVADVSTAEKAEIENRLKALRGDTAQPPQK